MPAHAVHIQLKDCICIKDSDTQSNIFVGPYANGPIYNFATNSIVRGKY